MMVVGHITRPGGSWWPLCLNTNTKRETLDGVAMNVGEILEAKGTGVITVGPAEAVWSVLRKYRVHQIGTLVVVDDSGEPLGLLSERDLVNGLIAHGKRLLDQPVRDVMSTGVATCHPEDAVGHILHTMTDRRTRHMPVIADGELIGMISIGDVVKTALSDAELEVKVLRDMARIRR